MNIKSFFPKLVSQLTVALYDTQIDSNQCLNFASNWFDSIFDSKQFPPPVSPNSQHFFSLKKKQVWGLPSLSQWYHWLSEHVELGASVICQWELRNHPAPVFLWILPSSSSPSSSSLSLSSSWPWSSSLLSLSSSLSSSSSTSSSSFSMSLHILVSVCSESKQADIEALRNTQIVRLVNFSCYFSLFGRQLDSL